MSPRPPVSQYTLSHSLWMACWVKQCQVLVQHMKQQTEVFFVVLFMQVVFIHVFFQCTIIGV